MQKAKGKIASAEEEEEEQLKKGRKQKTTNREAICPNKCCISDKNKGVGKLREKPKEEIV